MVEDLQSLNYLGIGLDAALVVLLLLAIYMAIRIAKSLSVFNKAKADMRHLIETLSAEVDEAQSAIINLKANSNEIAADLRALINKAEILSNDLALAERKNKKAPHVQAEQKVSSKPVKRERQKEAIVLHNWLDGSDDAGSSDDSGEFGSEAERELFKAMMEKK